MQDNNPYPEYLDPPSVETDVEDATPAVGRHRRETPPSRRTLTLLILAALAASGAGIAVLAAGDPRIDTVTTGVEERAEAADRADRSGREPVLVSPTESASASAPPSALASPSASATPIPAQSSAAATATQKPAGSATAKATKTTASWVNPMPGAAVTSCFGMRWGVLHAGIDLAMPAGTPIRAAAAGTAVKAGDDGDGYGISVFIQHSNGDLTHYAHLSRLAVSVGDKVSTGEVIGYEGATGDATGPHLHFEVHQGQMWNQIDPAPYMRARGLNLGC